MRLALSLCRVLLDRDDPALSRRPTEAPTRLRRQSTRCQPYHKGQRVSIVLVPQPLAGGWGPDVGHISLLIADPDDGTLASVGFYSKSYRQGLRLLSKDDGVLVSPDPVYMKAVTNSVLRHEIKELYRTTLTTAQAAQLNRWTDDEDGDLTLSRFTTRDGHDRELAVTRLEGTQYMGVAALTAVNSSGNQVANCATWAQMLFPGVIACPFGVPRLCHRVDFEKAKNAHSEIGSSQPRPAIPRSSMPDPAHLDDR